MKYSQIFTLGLVSALSPYDPVEWKGSVVDIKTPGNLSLSVFLPETSTALPLTIFFTGFGSNLPSFAYSDVIKQMAVKSNSAYLTWSAFPNNPLDQEANMKKMTDLSDFVHKGGLVASLGKDGSKVNTKRVMYASHSSGAQLAVQISRYAPGDAVLLLDPVDADPAGWTKQVLSVPGTLPGPFSPGTPVLILSSELCDKERKVLNLSIPPCCPKEFSSSWFWNNTVGVSRVWVTADFFGHADILNDPWALGGHWSKFCTSVSDRNVHPFSANRAFISGVVASFSRSVLGECDQVKFLFDQTLWNSSGKIVRDVIKGNKCFSRVGK